MTPRPVAPAAPPPASTPLPFTGRLFLALPLSDAVRAALVERLTSALGGQPLPGRRVAPENWHLTLRFLGDTDAATGRRLVEALQANAFGPPFVVEFGGLGAFPRALRAQTLWLGVQSGVPELRALAAAVERAVTAAGFAPDDRPFAAHLTLSRLRPPADVRAVLAAVPATALALPVDRVLLFQSHLGRAGPTYVELAAFPLR